MRERSQRRLILTSLGLMLGAGALGSSARAASITLGTYSLLPNTPGQEIDIDVEGGDAVQGVDLEVMTADGGPDVGGKIDAPKISDVDLFAPGAVFENNNTGYLMNAPSSFNPAATESQLWQAATTVQNGSVDLGWPNHLALLAVLTIDTTGFTSGSFPLVLDNPAAPTNFPTIGGVGPTTPVVTDGTIVIAAATGPTIVEPPPATPDVGPEPSVLGFAAVCVPAMLLKRRRRC